MKFKMAQNSVFAVLLRSSWWISAAIAVLLLVLAQAIASPFFSLFLSFAAIPFLVIAGISGWKRRNLPSPRRIEETAGAVRAMSWPMFSGVLQEGLRRDGCEVKAIKAEHGDFELDREGRLAVVSARRWKASRVGVQALEGLDALRQRRGAHEAIYVTTGEISEQAVAYAHAHQIKFLATPELARLLPRELFARR